MIQIWLKIHMYPNKFSCQNIFYHFIEACPGEPHSIYSKVKSMVGWFMVFNATFNNISVISWRSVLLMEETEHPEKTTYIMLYRVHLAMNEV